MSKKVCRFNEQWLKDDRFKDTQYLLSIASKSIYF